MQEKRLQNSNVLGVDIRMLSRDLVLLLTLRLVSDLVMTQ